MKTLVEEEVKANPDKEIGTIYETMNYPKFSFLEGNRPVKHRSDLIRDIQKHGIKEPITVNEDFEIIDGQHRFTIAQKYRIPVPYKIEKGANIDSTVSFNSNLKKWVQWDYINRYAKTGNDDYKKLLDILESKRYPVATVVKIGLGIRSLGSGKVTKIVSNGDFKFYNYDEFIKFLSTYERFVQDTGVEAGRDLMSAFFNIYSIKGFKYPRMAEKCKANDFAERIRGLKNQSLILEHLVNIYNERLNSTSDTFLQYEYDIRTKVLTLTGEVNHEVAL